MIELIVFFSFFFSSFCSLALHSLCRKKKKKKKKTELSFSIR